MLLVAELCCVGLRGAGLGISGSGYATGLGHCPANSSDLTYYDCVFCDHRGLPAGLSAALPVLCVQGS